MAEGADQGLPAASTTRPGSRARAIGTFGLVMATAIQAADALIANVALPQLQKDLGGGIELGTWVVASYLCATAVMAPLTGSLRRRFGARRLFPAAMSIFGLASLLCALAPSFEALVLLRIVQGAAGGLIHPLAQAIVLDIYPGERHARMLSVLGAGVMIGPIFGPPLGGIITDLASWRWVFVCSVPIALLSILCVWPLRSVPETTRISRIDGLGAFLLIIGIAALELFLQRGIRQSWFHSTEIIVEAAIAIVVFALLVLRGHRSGFGAFRPDVFKNINFVVAAFYNFTLSAILFVTIVFLPSLAQEALGYSAAAAGGMIVPRAILMTLVILSVGRLVGKVPDRVLLVGGWTLMALGLVVLSQTNPENGVVWIIAGSAIQAVGAGMLYTPLSTLAFTSVARDLRTDATGLYSLLRQLGYASGIALMSAVLQAKTSTHLAEFSIGILPGPLTELIPLYAARAAYFECFVIMAIACAAIIPGLWLFRPSVHADADATPK